MPTYVKPYSYIGGRGNYGSGYDLNPQWYKVATGFYGEGDYANGVGVPSDSPPAASDIKTYNLISNQHREFHYRFIAVPNPLILNNPVYDTDIPFRLWNTFKSPDEASAATITGSSVITSSFNTLAEIRDFQWKEYAIQVAEGEQSIDADLDGVFTQGSFKLDIIGNVVLIVEDEGQRSVREVWRWNTKVITAWDSTEQRIQYAPYPVREYTAEYFMDEDEIREFEKLLYQSVNGTVSIPIWPMECFTTQETLAPQERLYFPVENTNLRDGENIYLVSPTGFKLILTIDTLETDGATLTSGVPLDVGMGWSVYPLQPLFINNPQIRIKTITANVQLGGEATNRDRPVQRAGAVASIPTFNSLPVLDFRALSDVKSEYQNFYEEVGTPFGRRERTGIWPRPRVLRSASFRVDRKGAMTTGYELACVFFDQIAGMRESFYFSSKQADLVVNTPPGDGSTQLIVDSADYESIYFPSAIYKNLEIKFRDGTYRWYTINSATTNVGGTTTLGLASSLPLDVMTNPITRVSFLLRVRLATDTITLVHINNRTTFAFSIIGTET